MAVKVTSPGSSAVVEISDELVERYEAQGWTRVKTRATRSKSDKSEKSESSDEK